MESCKTTDLLQFGQSTQEIAWILVRRLPPVTKRIRKTNRIVLTVRVTGLNYLIVSKGTHCRLVRNVYRQISTFVS